MGEDLERALREALRGSLFRRNGRELTIECESETRADSLHGLLVRAEVRAVVAEQRRAQTSPSGDSD